jgi:o-succinylbenzoate---CoA ligase
MAAVIHLAPGEPEPAGLAEFAHGVAGDVHLFATSGSEGLPKWVALSAEAMRVSARAVNDHLAATAEDRWLVALPEHHVGGYSILARAAESGAAVMRAPAKWKAELYAELCAEQGITLSSLVPTQVFDLVKQGLRGAPSLRAIVVGGGGLSQELGLAAQALGWPVLQSYGMTESASQVATQALRAEFDPTRLRVLPHWQVAVDDEQRLVLSGAALASGYVWQDGEAWQWEPLRQPFVTRDRVVLEEPWLRFLGREADMLKILGELVSLVPLQERLSAMTDKATLAAVADERMGTALWLAHELPEPEGLALMERYNASVRAYERCVKAVQMELPRSALGKIQRAELLRRIEGR